jgi:urea transporter
MAEKFRFIGVISFMRTRILLLALFTFVFCTWVTLIAAYGQESGDGTEEAVELLPPDYVNATYGFGIALPDGYYSYETEENGIDAVSIEGNSDEAKARITIEELPDDVMDVAGFWQFMKDRDSMMARNITYEKIDSIAGVGAVQARVERIERSNYILAITWAFVHDGYGFTLTGYPPAGADFNSARDLTEQLSQQFRWMTDEEIEEYQAANAGEPEIVLPEGEEF